MSSDTSNVFSQWIERNMNQIDEQDVSGAARVAVQIPDDAVFMVRCLISFTTPRADR